MLQEQHREYKPENDPNAYNGINNGKDNLIDFPTASQRENNGINQEFNNDIPMNREVANMDWMEKYIDSLNRTVEEIKNDSKETRKELHDMESRMADRIDSKLDSKLEEFRNEMRHLDNQRAEDMREVRNSLESTNKHVQSMVSSVHSISIATVIGVAAMVISVLGIWYSVSSNQAEISKQIQQQNVQIQEIQKSIKNK